jgi:hypothetical protein
MGVLGYPTGSDEGKDDPSVVPPGPIHQVVDLKGEVGLAGGRKGNGSSPIPGSDLVQPERETTIVQPGLHRPDGSVPRCEQGKPHLRRSGARLETVGQRDGDRLRHRRELDSQLPPEETVLTLEMAAGKDRRSESQESRSDPALLTPEGPFAHRLDPI